MEHMTSKCDTHSYQSEEEQEEEQEEKCAKRVKNKQEKLIEFSIPAIETFLLEVRGVVL